MDRNISGRLHVVECLNEWHIAGPYYLEDEEGTLRAEGICCREHAQWMADGYNHRIEKKLNAETS